MHILLVNQFLPPDSSPTARLLGELGETLAADGHTVTYIGESGGYRARKTVLGSRALRELGSLCRILVKGSVVSGIDAIICFTSPPLLPFIAYLLSLRHRAKLVHWAMDVYPDVAVALGEVRPRSIVHRITAAFMQRAYRHTKLAVALDADMEQLLRRHGAPKTARCAPWPPKVHGSGEAALVCKPDCGSAFTWLYSGNLGRAHEWKTLLDAQKNLEEKGLSIGLVFQGGGPERAAAIAYASQIRLEHCRWIEYAPEDQLLTSHLAAGAIVVTQRPETRGQLWPSKLALAFHLPVPIVFVGDRSSSVANAVSNHNAASSAFSVGADQALADHIESIANEPSGSRPPEMVVQAVQEQRALGREKWCRWLRSL